MLNIDNAFKEKMKVYGKHINILVEFGETQLDKTYVKNAEFTTNGEMFTSIMRGLTLEVEKYTVCEQDKMLTVGQVHNMLLKKVINTKIKRFTTEDYEFYQQERKQDINFASTVNVKLGVRLSEEDEYQYIDYGEFVVYDRESIVDTNSSKLYLYDHLIDTHVNYDDDPLTLNYNSGNITVLNLLQAICTKFGFNLMTSNFANYDKVINSDKYLGLNVTYRDILDEIAEVSGGFIKIFNKDLYVAYPQNTGEVIDENDLEKLTVGKKVGAFNSLVLGRTPQEDNIYYPQNIAEENRVCVRIDNNQIMDSNRENFILNIYNKINGLEYYVFEFESFGFGYFEFGDIVTLRDLDGVEYSTILFNIVENVTSGIKGKCYTEETEYSETKYEYASSIEKRLVNTEIICNKQENKINLLIEEQGENATKINSLEMDLDSTKSQIQNLEEETDQRISSIEQTASSITSTVTNIVYQRGVNYVLDSKQERTANSTTYYSHDYDISPHFHDVLTNQFTVSFMLKGASSVVNGAVAVYIYFDNTNAVKTIPLTVDNSTDYKRYYETFTLDEDEIEHVEQLHIGMSLDENTSSNFAIKHVKLEIGDSPTDWTLAPEEDDGTENEGYYTKGETTALIQQSANSITSSVSSTYSTKSELNTAKAEIKQTTDSISSTVSTKVGDNEIISKINQSAENISIHANKIDIIGKKVKFQTNTETSHTYTSNDIDKITNYVLGSGSLTQSEKELYDINNDGVVNVDDVLLISDGIIASGGNPRDGGTYTDTGTFEINPDATNRSIILRDSNDEILTSIGLRGMQTIELGAETIHAQNIYAKQNIRGANIGAGTVLGTTTLYSNSSGTTGTVTLSNSASNYDYLELFYMNGSRISWKYKSISSRWNNCNRNSTTSKLISYKYNDKYCNV